MAMVKNKSDWKGILVAVIAFMVVFLLLQFVFIGWVAGVGPFRRLKEARMSHLEGNQQEYDVSNVQPMEGSPLAGGKICILGSSVAFGSGSGGQAVGEYLAARLGAQLYKEAVSGTTLTDVGDTSYVSRLKTIPAGEGFDLFLCQLSTNDAAASLPLGEVAEGTDLDGFDTSTVTGAMEYIIAYAKETWGCPVAFFTECRYESSRYEAMVEVLKELQVKWGIGVLDLWSDDEFNTLTDQELQLYMTDSVHPTKAGYNLWWGPELERQLLDFLGK